jgi:hypothetical protein
MPNLSTLSDPKLDDDIDLAQLHDANGGYWGAHPDHPLEDWLYEVANHDTRRGYWEWVEARIANGQ